MDILVQSWLADRHKFSVYHVPPSSSSGLQASGSSGLQELYNYGGECFGDSAVRYLRHCAYECGGLLYFDKIDGNGIICNPTTRQLKFIPPSGLKDQPMLYRGICFGYDKTNEDFKVVRILRYYVYDDNDEFLPDKELTVEVYSTKTSSWKDIDCPPCSTVIGSHIVYIEGKKGGYANGNCYWHTRMNGIESILSFNFATETFSVSPAPFSVKRGYLLDFVNRGDKSRVAIYEKPIGPRTNKDIQIWELEEESGLWENKCRLVFENWMVPLALKNGLLFLEGVDVGERHPPHIVRGVKAAERCRLLVYDLDTRKLMPLEVFGWTRHMRVFSFTESGYLLPDACPMSEDDEE